MMGSKFLAVFKWVFSRAGIAYLLIALAAGSFIDFKAMASRVKTRRLNDARPEMYDLVMFGKGGIPADKFNWKPYLEYFLLVVKYMPGEEVAKMFLGVSQYYAGSSPKTSWVNIQHAAEEYPYIFWSLYNAGVLAFERGNMILAVRYLDRALVMPTDQVKLAIEGSIVYRQLMTSPNFDVRIMDEVDGVRENVYLILSAASFYAKDYDKSRMLALYALSKMNVKDKEPFYFYAGAASMGLGKMQEAMSFMSRCVELKSKNPMVYRYGGEMLMASGKSGVAEDVLRTSRILEASQPKGFPYPERLRLRFF